ncbi:MAG: phosphoribosyltransferase family protein [Patescibacteria group bacterium]|jgi:orotate phosphoribosyltransferase
MNKPKIIKALYKAQNVYCDYKKPLLGGAGLYQPIYLDHRNLLSYPKELSIVFNQLKGLLPKHYNIIAGNESAGIAFAGILARALVKPMIYVRKKPKTNGTKKQIEGILKPGQKVVLIDDMMVTGSNINNAVKVLRKNKAKVEDVIVVSIVKKELAKKIEKASKIKIHYLVTFQEIANFGIKHNIFDLEDTLAIKQYLKDPINWGSRIKK